ncbi:DUF1566 domain-containing protein [Vibrio pectenicida]|uniref:Lcl domain-containing protein n=1 Tax=Vibrio pectenicida TaxID=62763 RepID=UPI003B9CBB90
MKIVAQTFGIMACAAFIAGCGGGNESDPKLEPTNLAASTTTNSTTSDNGPKFPAAKKMKILSTQGDKPTYGNMISWDYLSVSIWNSPVTFDQPEHYEYTLDGGSTWQTVVSKPQFLGTQAYAKSKVGIRVRQNALEGMSSPPSETLFATTSRGEFVALQFVPMKNINQVVTFGDKGWDYTQAKCVAEYKPDGSGEPIFGAKRRTWGENNVQLLNEHISQSNACGIHEWKLPDIDEVKSALLLPAELGNFSEFVVSKFAGNVVHVDQEQLVVVYLDKVSDDEKTKVPRVKALDIWNTNYLYIRWSLPIGIQLVDKIDGAELTQKVRLNEQADTLQDARDAVVNLLSLLDNATVDYARLSAENDQHQTLLSSALASWQDIYSGHQPAMTFFVQQAVLAKHRSDSKSQEFVLKVNNYVSDWGEYEYNFLVAAALLKELQAVDSLVKLQQKNAIIASSIAALDVTQDGKNQQIGANRLHKVFFTSQHLRAELTAWLESLPNLKSNSALALIDKYDLLSHYDKEKIGQLITEAREKAQNSGEVVSQPEAMIVDAAGKQYAKVDKAGLYLAKDATYEQGWRCVLELGSGDKRRIWMLLPRVEENALEYLAYQGSNDESKNVLGPKGYVSKVNQEAPCGVSDWKVPNILQLQSLASGYVKPSGYLSDKGLSIDTNVFVNHPYNQQVYYWSSKPEKEGKQTAYSYASINDNDNNKYNDSDKEVSKPLLANNMAALVRLVSENTLPNQWQYLDVSGGLVENRVEASCAKNLVTGHIWQLFDDNDNSKRLVSQSELMDRLNSQNSNQVCGASNWRLQGISELTSLLPIDRDVFINSEVVDPNLMPPRMLETYFISITSTSDNSFSHMNLKDRQFGLDSNKYLYRFIATP